MIHYQHQWSLIVWAKGVLRRNVGGDWRFNIHEQKPYLESDSEDDFWVCNSWIQTMF